MHPDEWPALRSRIAADLKSGADRFSRIQNSLGPVAQGFSIRSYVIQCYRRILRHDPDPVGLERYTQSCERSRFVRSTLKIRLFLSQEKRMMVREDLKIFCEDHLPAWLWRRWL
ncbi:MAG: hypothetical protein HS115_00070 [Spirochaetales bacterium]|nr:hypothetical protein [Spirochaetales bacterium]